MQKGAEAPFLTIPLDAREAEMGPGEYRDAQVPGLILRVWDTSRAWALRYTYAGKRQRIRLGKGAITDLEAARTLARMLLSGLDRGEDPRATLRRYDASSVTVAGLCRDMLAGITVRPKTRYDWGNILRRNIEGSTIGDIPAPALARDAIKAWGAALVKSSGGHSSNRAFEVVRRAYTYGLEMGTITASPFAGLKPPFAGEVGRGRYLTPEELSRLVGFLVANPCGFSDAVLLLIYTVKRRGQVENSRRGEWDLAAKVWTAPSESAGSKGSPDDRVALSTQAVAVAARMLKMRSPYLFPAVRRKSHGVIDSDFVVKLKTAVGAEKPWTLHCLRATFATHAQELFRADLSLIATCLGHVPAGIPESTRAYALSQRIEEKRELLQKWADWVDPVAQPWPKSPAAEASKTA